VPFVRKGLQKRFVKISGGYIRELFFSDLGPFLFMEHGLLGKGNIIGTAPLQKVLVVI
jgi:hypothetical protein